MSDTSLNWPAWLDEHSPKLLLFARTQTRSEPDAEDLLQEAIVEAARKSGGTPPDLPLVYATLRRRAIDLARRTDRRSAREEAVMKTFESCWFDDCVEQQEKLPLLSSRLRQEGHALSSSGCGECQWESPRTTRLETESCSSRTTL